MSDCHFFISVADTQKCKSMSFEHARAPPHSEAALAYSQRKRRVRVVRTAATIHAQLLLWLVIYEIQNGKVLGRNEAGGHRILDQACAPVRRELLGSAS